MRYSRGETQTWLNGSDTGWLPEIIFTEKRLGLSSIPGISKFSI